MSARHFRDLDVWKVAMELARRVYTLTADFPAQEQYGLSSQMQRAAVSVPSNIAEGNARASRKAYLHFLSIASGSTAELQTQLLLARDLGLADGTGLQEAMKLAERVSQMLFRLRQSLQQDVEHRIAEDDAEYEPNVEIDLATGPGSRIPGPASQATTHDPIHSQPSRETR